MILLSVEGLWYLDNLPNSTAQFPLGAWMSGNLPTDICNLLVTQMTLLVPFLSSNVDVAGGWRIDVVSDELPEAPDDVFEGAARYE